MKISQLCRASVSLAAIFFLTNVPSANAITYDVNRSWTDVFGTGTATLVGTVDVPIGNYTIMNGGPAPFTNINLILTLNGVPALLDHVDTSDVFGTAAFLINATASALIFDVASADGQNPADVNFYDTPQTTGYTIGFDGAGGFEAGRGPTAGIIAFLQFPTTFGTAGSSAVPETASTLALMSFTLFGLAVALKLSAGDNSGSERSRGKRR